MLCRDVNKECSGTTQWENVSFSCSLQGNVYIISHALWFDLQIQYTHTLTVNHHFSIQPPKISSVTLVFSPSSTISSSSWFDHVCGAAEQTDWLLSQHVVHRDTDTLSADSQNTQSDSAHSPKVSWSPNRHRDGRIGSSTDIHRAVISVAVPTQKKTQKGQWREKTAAKNQSRVMKTGI